MPSSIVRSRILLFAALLLGACGGKRDTPAGLIPRERFVAANVAVRALPDSATPAERKAALKKAGVTERQLRTWVNLHARRDPEALSKTWEEIAFKVDSVSGGQPIPPPSAGGPPPGAIPPPVMAPDTSVLRARRDSVLASARRRDSIFGQGAPPPAPRRGPPGRRPRAVQQ